MDMELQPRGLPVGKGLVDTATFLRSRADWCPALDGGTLPQNPSEGIPMLQDLLTALNSGYTLTAVIIGVVAVALRVLTMFGKALDFHDKHFVEKRHKRLLELRSSVTGDPLLTDYLSEAINLEAFRIASGIRASSLRARALMTLANLGYWDNTQIRRASRYLVATADNPNPRIEIDLWDKISAWYGLFAGAMFVLLGAIMGYSFMASVPKFGVVIGLPLFIAMTFAGALLAADWVRYKTALRVRAFLEEHPATFQDIQEAAVSQT